MASPSGDIQSFNEGPLSLPEVTENENTSGSSQDIEFSIS